MEVLSSRVSVARNENGTSIVISSLAERKKSRTVAVILSLWIIGGVIMIWSFPSIQQEKTKIIVLIWMAFWLYFLYVLARLWRWKKYGHEVIKINKGVLKYKKDVKGRGWVNDFQLEKIKRVRSNEEQSPGWLKNMGGDFWNTDCDSLRFDYEDREISLGFQLEPTEREKLLGVLGEFVETEAKQSKRSQKGANWKSDSE